MNLDKKIANAVGGKTARACDCCLTKRARWYCSADDAFLCQACDASVHSANALARRHDRVQLKTASFKPLHSRNPINLPTWQRGPIKKTRTPRHGKNFEPNLNHLNSNPILTVPELGLDESNFLTHEDEGEDSFMYRVPVSEEKYEPLDIDLEEFAVDVETLLGNELDEERYGMEKLGFFVDGDGKDHITPIDFFKDEDELLVNGENDDLTIRESFDFCFEYGDDDGGCRGFLATCEDQKIGILDDDDSGQSFPTSCEGHKIEVPDTLKGCEIGDNKNEECDERVSRSNEMIMMLRLDYEAICEAWGSQGSPWMNGQRPQINHDDYWSHSMRGTNGAEMCEPSIHIKQQQTGIIMEGNSVTMIGDGGREARVSRYREKRRTRLFAKKIRYEVRKLNAEKRPRMKGRFVKRSFFASATSTFSLGST